MDLDEAIYPLAFGADIANVEVGRVRAWKQKGYIRLGQHDVPPSAPGATTYITKRRILQIAIAAKLTSAGLHPNHAFSAAAYFSDSSDALEAPGFMRLPGQTFESGNTGLIAWPGCGIGKVFRFVGDKMELPFYAPDFGTQSIAVAIWLDQILNDVKKRLRTFGIEQN